MRPSVNGFDISAASFSGKPNVALPVAASKKIERLPWLYPNNPVSSWVLSSSYVFSVPIKIPVKVLSSKCFLPAPICGASMYPSSSLISTLFPSQPFNEAKPYKFKDIWKGTIISYSNGASSEKYSKSHL